MEIRFRIITYLLLLTIFLSGNFVNDQIVIDQKSTSTLDSTTKLNLADYKDSNKHNNKQLETNYFKIDKTSPIKTDNTINTAPEIITSGSPSTYLGNPLTNDTFGVNWTQAIKNENFSQNGDVSINMNFHLNFTVTETLKAENLTLSQGLFTPEYTKDVYLLAGSYVTGKLDWDGPSNADFDLLLIHSWGQYDFRFDIFGCRGCSLSRPENIIGYIPTDGMYKILVDFYNGDITDYNFTLDFSADKSLISFKEPFDSAGAKLSLVENKLTNGIYDFSTEYISDLNEKLQYNGTFIFDNKPPDIADYPNQLDTEIAENTYYITIDPNNTDKIQLFELWDPISYNYSISFDGNLYESKTNQTNLVDIMVGTEVWPSELDTVTFNLTTTDFLGRTAYANGTIIRADTVRPTITVKPPSTPNVKFNESFLFAWVVDDVYPYGTYTIMIGYDVVQSGIWMKGQPVYFNHTFLEKKQYILIFTAKDAFSNFGNSGTVTDSISFYTYEIYYNSNNNGGNDRSPAPIKIYPTLLTLACIFIVSKKRRPKLPS